jgi:Ca2+-binding EF-hand superfamily protein
MIKTFCAVVVLAAACTVPAMVSAQSREPMTLAAMQAKADETFNTADFDQSGVLSTAELTRAAQDQGAAGQGLARADANHDGRVTRDEYHAAYAAVFARLDTDHDGVISNAERRQFRGFDLGRGMLGTGSGVPTPDAGQ